MAISTYMVFLMHNNKSGGPKWEKLIDIKSYPDLGGDPEMLDTTTLSDKMKTSIPGVQDLEALKFEANYTPEDYKKLSDLAGKDEEYAVWFGGSESLGVLTPDGKKGKYSFTGDLRVFVTGGGVNEVVGMTINIAPSTVIKDVTNAE